MSSAWKEPDSGRYLGEKEQLGSWEEGGARLVGGAGAAYSTGEPMLDLFPEAARLD